MNRFISFFDGTFDHGWRGSLIVMFVFSISVSGLALEPNLTFAQSSSANRVQDRNGLNQASPGNRTLSFDQRDNDSSTEPAIAVASLGLRNQAEAEQLNRRPDVVERVVDVDNRLANVNRSTDRGTNQVLIPILLMLLMISVLMIIPAVIVYKYLAPRWNISKALNSDGKQDVYITSKRERGWGWKIRLGLGAAIDGLMRTLYQVDRWINQFFRFLLWLVTLPTQLRIPRWRRRD